jgi:uncharacterized membrane protein YoaK (UPF0700 family)
VLVTRADNWRAIPALLFLLSVIAGCTDVIGFLGLNGLFTSHITGNLVVLAAHVAVGVEAETSRILAVPVFVVVISLTMLAANGLAVVSVASLRPMLLSQFVLLCGFLVLCVAASPMVDPNAYNVVAAGMVGVSAMAVQNALVQISLPGAPATAVMTTNVTHFAIDVGRVLRGGDPVDVARARGRAVQTLRVIVGFAIGCGIGAACEVMFGLWSLALPAGLGLVAFVIGCVVETDEARGA